MCYVPFILLTNLIMFQLCPIYKFTQILHASVSLGNIYDSKRSEPGSWMVVGVIPAFSMKKATLAGRKKDGMGGCARRRIQILQLSYGKLLENWNAKTKDVKKLQWADGLWRLCKMIISAFLGDQPEVDAVCCDTSQSCKLCKCSREHYHLPGRHRPKFAVFCMQKVYSAARGAKILVGNAWKAASQVTQAAYRRARKAAGGIHLIRNTFWNILNFDVQRRTFKDPMHAMDHGNSISICSGVVKRLQALAEELGLARGYFVTKLTARLYHVCDSQDRRHLTLFNFVNQSILEQFEKLGQVGAPTKKGEKPAPRIVDASDMQALMVCLPYLFGWPGVRRDSVQRRGGNEEVRLLIS